jgi:hypothetical protein
MMNDLIARKRPPACRDDDAGTVKRTMQPALRAISGLHHRSLVVDMTVLATPDQLTRDAAIDALGGSTMPASASGVQPGLPEANPNQPSIAKAFASDPSLVVPVIASLEEVLLARELRQQLKKRYLDRPTQPCSLWCVGID